ncbi:MAG: hypothetical protein AMXMBFR34_41480 [Myxococcaceae bacterium]
MVSTVSAILALSLSTVPIPSGKISNTPISIDLSDGDQYDPHVDGDLAAYSHADISGRQEIRYYRFGAGTPSSAIPNGGGADYLSDIDRGRIAFTRTGSGNPLILIFDTTLPNPQPQVVNEKPAMNRAGTALGDQIIAYGDFTLASEAGTAEMVAYDLSTGAEARLSNDLLNDTNPAVSPGGDVVVWEKCVSFINCEIYQAVKTGTAWVVSVVSAPLASGSSINPDTNGGIVVYHSDRGAPTGYDIYVRPVAGGPEEVLEIGGRQTNPSVRGSVIAFESGIPADIYLYERTTNRLFQVTEGPGNETLNDVTLLPSGEVRLVWTTDDGADGYNNVYGATFSLPPPVDTCQPRTATLQASREYCPSRWNNADVSFATPFTFALPAEIPVTAGNAGNHWAELTLHTTSGCETKCKYRGGSNYSHPQSQAERAKGARYEFEFCTGQGQGLAAGSLVQVDRVELQVVNGDSWQGTTSVELTLAGVCGPPPPPICGDDDDDGCGGGGHGHHGHGHHGHGHQGGGYHGGHGHQGGGHHGGGHGHGRSKSSGDDEVGAVAQALDPEPAPATGCSSTSPGFAWSALFAALAFFFLRRSTPIRLAQTQERRRLPR